VSVPLPHFLNDNYGDYYYPNDDCQYEVRDLPIFLSICYYIDTIRTAMGTTMTTRFETTTNSLRRERPDE
jgi:hypothetical protein